MSDTGCAVIVEPRHHRALKFVIETAAQQIPPEWPIQVFHGTQNYGYVQHELAALIESKRVVLHNMQVPNLTRTMYSQMFLTTEFWEKCLGEHILIFQTDSTFLPTSPHKLTDFLDWDYIGAPFFDKTVGNGGFSLRKKSSSLVAVQKMTAAQKQSVQKGDMHEDGYFVNFFKCHPQFRLAPLSEAQKFSVESVYYDRPLGVHQPWSCIGLLGNLNYQKLLLDNPVLQQLVRLNQAPVVNPVVSRKSHTPRHQTAKLTHARNTQRRRTKSVGLARRRL